ncbi:MFS general substrate transporter [Myriangium duriaei CBS 260.36]|uniref:MFS general substrate transporter n=1 Tax=Myriangium duriaei CBS 260.36 TaxID=1168546 RepID=A0A9P4MFX3_9PEZI|nr:MFS general substrate transporter [Myriangium duriaei CBS 260.36]
MYSDPENLKTVPTTDTVHNDEAVRVLHHYDGAHSWSDEEENKLLRKVDWRVMPVLCLVYMLVYYDKAILSQAAIFGLRQQLHLTIGNRYSMSAAIFYLGFILGSYPAIVLAQRFPVERVASAIVTLWGLTLILTTVCTSYQGIYAQRFVLGFLEAGISPMFMLIVGSFYKKSEQAFRMGIWYSTTGYVSVFSPLINYGLGKINGGLNTWRYMYYFTGSITMLVGLVLYVIISPDPVRARGFNDRERYIMVARLQANNTGVKNKHFKSAQLIELLLDPKFWIIFSIAFLSMIANGAISTFVPIVIEGFGFTAFNSLLLLMPVGFYAGSAMLLLSFLAGKLRNSRTILIFLAQMGTTLASILLWKLPTKERGALLFACIILPSIGAGYAVLMGLQVANTAGYTKRSMASSGLYIGYCLGNFVGPLVFKANDAPRYPKGFLVVVITAIAAGILALIYRGLCMYTNSQRDKSGVPEGFDHAYEDDLTDKTVSGYTSRLSHRNERERTYVLLQTQSDQGISKCSNCTAANRECEVRVSKRGRKRHMEEDIQQTQVIINTPARPVHRTQSFHVPVVPSPAPVTSISPAQVVPEVASAHFNQTPTSSSVVEGVGRSHQNDVDTGYLQVYGHENHIEAELADLESTLEQRRDVLDPKRRQLLQTFAETYWDYCYCWCPVLDPSSFMEDIDRSPMLANAVALAGSHVRPPLLSHDGPKVYYDKARALFYDDAETNSLTALQALCLFYWWAPRATSTIHRHSSWWWTSVIIRHAQQMGIHREPPQGHPLRSSHNLSLRRRIWWTVFARERLTALCQSKPSIIDPDDCNILEPQLSDFPNDTVSQKRALVFIHWVKLCAILGRMAKVLGRSSDNISTAAHVGMHESLVSWVHNLPTELKLQISTTHTDSFDRDIHQLHLPYFTAIIILHLRRSAHDLPQALPPAILAASCTVRILGDILLRGSCRYLMPITCWYAGTAFIPLLQAVRMPPLSGEAEEGIETLVSTVEQLQQMWGSANVIQQGFQRLRNATTTNVPVAQNPAVADNTHVRWSSDDADITLSPQQPEGIYDWTALFPFVTKQTNSIAGELFGNQEKGTVTRGLASPDNLFHYESMQNEYNGLLDPFMDFTFDIGDLNFAAQQSAEL